MQRRRWIPVALGLLVLGCGHADVFETTIPIVGPSSTGPDVRLTFNTNQDYWPAWTEDGRGILYAFIPSDNGGVHRCVGLLPAGGGARTWQLCDNRATQADSTSSFPAYALGADGRLLYVEAVARRGAGSTAPSGVTLFLADSANPFNRRALLTLPTVAAGTPVAWLADITWTGPTSFVALAQDFSAALHCLGCLAIDTLFPGIAVVRGTITSVGATLTAIPGTSGATGYSLAENGASVVFTLRDDRRLLKVPSSGGAAAAVTVVTPVSTAQLLGVSCKGTTCIVAVDPVTFTAIDGGVTFPSIGLGPMELRSVSLTSGTVQVLRTTSSIVATPQISPVSGDVVAQVGGGFGRIQTATTSGSDLHLYLGLLP